MNKTIEVRWSEMEPPETVHSDAELEAVLDRIAANAAKDLPTIVELHVEGHLLLLGLGLPQSFVHVESESGLPPYLVTVGDPSAEGEIAFFLHSSHHTEISRRNLIDAAKSREVVRKFIDTGRRSPSVEWEEV